MHETAQLECPTCDWHTVCGPAQMLDWLRRVRMVRRDTAPEPDLLPELFRAAVAKFTCPKCQHVGLALGTPEDEGDEAWGMARKCETCGRPIARERLEIFPDTRVCVACQAADDAGAGPVDQEYCPRCGSVMKLVQRSSGLARYAMKCPSCPG